MNYLKNMRKKKGKKRGRKKQETGAVPKSKSRPIKKAKSNKFQDIDRYNLITRAQEDIDEENKDFLDGQYQDQE